MGQRRYKVQYSIQTASSKKITWQIKSYLDMHVLDIFLIKLSTFSCDLVNIMEVSQTNIRFEKYKETIRF
jgi:hypothetical protein